MRAYVLWGLNQALDCTDWDFHEPIKEDEVELELKATSLNHRDVWITKGLYAGIVFPTILGSDGAGVLNGRRVIINPSLNWREQSAAQPEGFQVLGMPRHGTFAQKIRVPAENVFDIPDHLDFQEAASLPLAGLTAYRAVFTKGEMTAKDKVLINGVGGGVASMAFQIAVAIGCEVWVTSGQDWKIERAKALGAAGGANYKSTNWHKLLKQKSEGFDLIVDSAAGKNFQSLVYLANPGARIVQYGGTLGKMDGLSPQMIFWKQLSIKGSTMGSKKDFEGLLQFVKKYKFHPIIDQVFEFSQLNAAMEKMEQSAQFGKLVVNID